MLYGGTIASAFFLVCSVTPTCPLDGQAMLRGGRDRHIFAAGLYCHGPGRCLEAAQRVGYLRDQPAAQAAEKGLFGIGTLVTLCPNWDARALRRLVLIVTELAVDIEVHKCSELDPRDRLFS